MMEPGKILQQNWFQYHEWFWFGSMILENLFYFFRNLWINYMKITSWVERLKKLFIQQRDSKGCKFLKLNQSITMRAKDFPHDDKPWGEQKEAPESWEFQFFMKMKKKKKQYEKVHHHDENNLNKSSTFQSDQWLLERKSFKLIDETNMMFINTYIHIPKSVSW